MSSLSLMSKDGTEDSDLSELSLVRFVSFPRTPPENGHTGLIPSNLLIPDLDDTSIVPVISHWRLPLSLRPRELEHDVDHDFGMVHDTSRYIFGPVDQALPSYMVGSSNISARSERQSSFEIDFGTRSLPMRLHPREQEHEIDHDFAMVNETPRYHFDPDEQVLPSSVVGSPNVSVDSERWPSFEIDFDTRNLPIRLRPREREHEIDHDFAMVDETARYHFDPDEQAHPSSVVGSPYVSVDSEGRPSFELDFDTRSLPVRLRPREREHAIDHDFAMVDETARYHFDPNEQALPSNVVDSPTVSDDSERRPSFELDFDTRSPPMRLRPREHDPVEQALSTALFPPDAQAGSEWHSSFDFGTRSQPSSFRPHERDANEHKLSAFAALSTRAVGYREQSARGHHVDTEIPGPQAGQKLRRMIKHIYSTALLVFSVWLVIGVILTEKARLARDPYPFTTFFISWFLLVWLATMEGGQGCLIGLQGVEKKNYASSHPMTLKCTMLAHKGNNMERFIIGRQFLVFIVVFLANAFKVMHVPDGVEGVFLFPGRFMTGAAVVLTTITLGQLTAQVNAATCMLDFLNSRAMLFTTYVSLFIENTGILHSAYLMQILFSKIAGIPIIKELPRTVHHSASFWGRVLMSLALLVFAFTVTLSAVSQGKTTMWMKLPGPVLAILFFVLMVFIGMMEALQIALFEVIHMPEDYFARHNVAKANCKLAFEGKNLQAVLIGRQMCVTTCVF